MAIQVSPTSMNVGKSRRQTDKEASELQTKYRANQKNKKFLDKYNNQRVPLDSAIVGTSINPRTGTWQDDFVTDDEGIRIYEPLTVENRAAQIAFMQEEANRAQTVKVKPIAQELLTKDMDPLLAAATTSLGLPSGMTPDVSNNQMYGQLSAFSENLDTMSNPAELNDLTEAERLIDEGYAPINKIDPDTGKEIKGGLKQVVSGPGVFYNEGERIRQEKQTYENIDRQDLSLIIQGMQRDAFFLRNSLHTEMQNNEEINNLFEAWTKEEGGYLNSALNLGLILAYDKSIQDAVYADHSDKEYVQFAEYEEANEGEYDPRLWQSKDNRPYRTPKARAFEESLPNNIEKILGVKFDNRQQGQAVANTVLQALQNTNVRGVSIEKGTTPRYNKNARVIKEDINGTIKNEYPMEDIWVDSEARAYLQKSQGLRDLLHPQLRNHVSFKPEIDDMSKLMGKAGSSVRANAYAIQNSIPKKLDQKLLNIINHLYNRDSDWNEYMDGRDIKLKPQHYHILLQEDSYIRNNAPDEETFYTTKKPRGSGRAGEEELLMADIKPVRALTIAAGKAATIINLSKELDPKKYNKQEKALVASIMVHLGMDESLYEPTMRKYSELIQEGSEARLLGEALNQLSDLPIERNINADMQADKQIIPDILQTPERLIGSKLITDSLDSFQALRTLDQFLKAKEKGNVDKFSTKYITSADAAQSGQTIQAFQIGNWQAAMRGGLISGNVESWMNRPDKESRLELEKLYALATEKAQSSLHSLFKEDVELHSFAKEMFANGQGVLDERNLFDKQFAKGAIQGASYGQGEDGSRMAVTQSLIDYMNDAPATEVQSRIQAIKNIFGEDSVESSLDNPDTFRFTGEALRAVGSIANAFVNGMYASDTRLLEYSQEMRKAYNTYIRLLEYGGRDRQGGSYSLTTEQGGNWKAPHWKYTEPVTKPGQNAYSKPWSNKKGKTVSMVNENIPGDWKWFDLANEGSKTWYQENDPIPDVDSEIRSLLKKEPLYRSTGITRFPVVSIHGLDDLILSVALTEMHRKIKSGHYEKLGVPKDDGLTFFMSVWDSGRVPPLLLEPWAKEYNKAFLKTMKENNFLTQLGEGFENMMDSIPEKVENKIRRNEGSGGEWKRLQDQVNRIKQQAKKLREGSFQNSTAKDGTNLSNVQGLNMLLSQADQTMINQMGVPTETFDNKIEEALNAGTVFQEARLKGLAEMMAENAKRKRQ